MHSQFVVFFSFKGGVGRSSSMLNAARILAKDGKDVVIVDFDIAAPGIDIFEGTDKKKTKKELDMELKWKHIDEKSIKEFKENDKEKIEQEGVTEYLLNEINKIDNPKIASPSEIKKYVYRFYEIEIDEDAKETRRKYDNTQGKMHIFRAGWHENQAYYEKQRLLDSKLGEINSCINNYLRKKDSSETSDNKNKVDDKGEKYLEMIEDFKKSIDKLKPDYVLIDARPGISSISLLGMQKLADVIVLCFNLNPWNFESIKGIYRNLTHDWKNDIINKWLKIVLVITPIPRYAFQYDIYKNQKKTIAEEMSEAVNPGGYRDMGPIEVIYNEQMALQDKLMADDDQFKNDATYNAYDQLAKMLVRINPEDVSNKIKKAKDAKSIDETVDEFKRLSKVHENKNKVEILHRYGEFLLSVGRYKQAIDPFYEAVILSKELEKPSDETQIIYAGNSELYYFLGLAYFNTCKDKKFLSEHSHEKIRAFFKEAIKYFEESNTRGKQKDIALSAVGDSLFEESKYVRDDIKLGLLEQAKKNYKDSIILKPNEAEYHFKLGRLNAAFAILKKSNIEKRDYWGKSNVNFKDATQNRTDYAEAYFNWGKNLYYLSGLILEQKDELLDSATGKFRKAIENKRDYADAFYLWALSLSKKSNINIEEFNEIISILEKEGKTAQAADITAKKLAASSRSDPENRNKLLNDACVNFSRGTTYKKDFKEAYFFWGSVLFILQDQMKKLGNENEAKLYFRDAFYKLEQAISLFFDYTTFYFDPDEIDEIDKNTFVCISALETMFSGDENYNKLKEILAIHEDYESLFEPQFNNWLNKEELVVLEGKEKDAVFYQKLIYKAVVKDFLPTDTEYRSKGHEYYFGHIDNLSEEEYELYKSLKMSLGDMIKFIKKIVDAPIPDKPALNERIKAV